MSDFIGRKRQLEMLSRAWEEKRSTFIPIYGRRRIGKSELILRFMKDKPGIYYLGKKAPSSLQIREFLEVAAQTLEEPLLSSYPATGWADALDAVLSRLEEGQKLVLAFDEFQWMVEASPELPSILQERWDRTWQSSGRLCLILCGSYIGFMEREVLGRRSPLFGRRTAQILLRPFDYREAAQFHPRYSIVDRARTYSICGGVPYYLRAFSDHRSFESNLATQLLDEHGVLHHEPDFLLREELRDVESYYAILVAAAKGRQSAKEIAAASEIAPTSLPYYLRQLVELGYLAKRYPLVSGRKNTRQVRYELNDPLLKFWFRFVFPDQSRMRRLGSRESLQQLVRPKIEAYLGQCFERLCREALPFLYEREGVAAPFEVGEFWSKTVQIDVVGLREDGWTDLGECKWGKIRSATGLVRELERKAGLFPNSRNATLGRRIFTRQAAPQGWDSDTASWHDLESLYD